MTLNKVTIAKRYSDALFQVLDENHQLDDGYAELVNLKQVLMDNPELVRDLSAPILDSEQKESLLKPLIDNLDSPYIKIFVQQVFDYGRIGQMVAIIDEFGKLYDQKEGIVRANAVTAVPLTEQEKDKLTKTLSKRVNAKEVQLSTEVNKDIIGGVIVTSSDVVYDGSISTKISKIKRLLLR